MKQRTSFVETYATDPYLTYTKKQVFNMFHSYILKSKTFTTISVILQPEMIFVHNVKDIVYIFIWKTIQIFFSIKVKVIVNEFLIPVDKRLFVIRLDINLQSRSLSEAVLEALTIMMKIQQVFTEIQIEITKVI